MQLPLPMEERAYAVQCIQSGWPDSAEDEEPGWFGHPNLVLSLSEVTPLDLVFLVSDHDPVVLSSVVEFRSSAQLSTKGEGICNEPKCQQRSVRMF